MKQCPNCGLFTDERWRWCDDCGYDWADDPPRFPFRRKDRRAAGSGIGCTELVLFVTLLPPIVALGNKIATAVFRAISGH